MSFLPKDKINKMNELSDLFLRYTNRQPKAIEILPESGSNRKYYRLTDIGNKTVIGVIGTSLDENLTFIKLSNHFKKFFLPVPEILFVAEDNMSYLLEDLGNTSLFDFISEGRKTGIFSEEEQILLKETIDSLPDFQYKGAENLDFSICYPQTEFDRRTIMWDLNYFKYCFLKVSGLEFREDLLENDFEQFSNILLSDNRSTTFMYRDFQSRNVMVVDKKVYFIDFQGGRRGPVYYDVASFLWQAKANFPNSLRNDLLKVYLQSLKKYQPDVNENSFKEQLRYFVLFRILQVLGAYGFRGYIEKKSHFLESIPYAFANLKELLETSFPTCFYLQEILQQLIQKEELKRQAEIIEKDQLIVTIYSFSYRKGIPEDTSGNGGGYVFDCRSIHNPGRYEAYKKLTGLDQPVIDFLEKDGEITLFMKNVYALANKHVERYLERKFTHLMFSFGCTGGQHRSVYAAQHLADYLSQKYPVKIVLKHREQNF